MLSYALHPLHRRLVRATKGQKIFSALLMCSAVTVVIILPLLYLSALIGEELARTYKAAMTLVAQGGLLENIRRDYPFVSAVVDRLQEYERLTGTSPAPDPVIYLSGGQETISLPFQVSRSRAT